MNIHIYKALIAARMQLWKFFGSMRCKRLASSAEYDDFVEQLRGHPYFTQHKGKAFTLVADMPLDIRALFGKPQTVYDMALATKVTGVPCLSGVFWGSYAPHKAIVSLHQLDEAQIVISFSDEEVSYLDVYVMAHDTVDKAKSFLSIYRSSRR